WYNLEHRHSGIKFVTPEQRHTGVDIEILAQREALYRRARQAQPERWSGSTRDWLHIDVVRLNPDKAGAKKLESAA
ncbi:MAG: IS3 family transposase, partial [Gammaproteobacteria bacterium]